MSGNKFEAAVSAIVEVNTAFFDVLCGAMSLSFTRVWDGNDLRQPCTDIGMNIKTSLVFGGMLIAITNCPRDICCRGKEGAIGSDNLSQIPRERKVKIGKIESRTTLPGGARGEGRGERGEGRRK